VFQGFNHLFQSNDGASVATVVAVDAPPDTTRDRLLDAAERLLAERGLAATSVRAVCAEAGANVAAVHYHFGSKDALADAVLERRMGELTKRRLAMLEPLESQARPPTRAVVEALVRPLADFARDPDGAGRSYVRFLAGLEATNESDRIGFAFAPQYARLAPVLERSLPGVAPGVVAFRLDLVSAPLLAALADPDRALRHWRDRSPARYDDLVDALVDAVTGALEGDGP
jgi:AcrR family transcriptional regulator